MMMMMMPRVPAAAAAVVVAAVAVVATFHRRPSCSDPWVLARRVVAAVDAAARLLPLWQLQQLQLLPRDSVRKARSNTFSASLRNIASWRLEAGRWGRSAPKPPSAAAGKAA